MTDQWSRRDFLSAAAIGAGILGAGWAAEAGPAVRREAAEAVAPVSAFSKHLQYLDYRALADTVAEAGFDGIDLTVRAGGHVLPERVRDDLPRAVDAARAAGVAIPMITTELVSARDPHAEAILETAGRLGIRDYRLGWISYDEQRGITGTLEMLRSPLRDLAAMGERCGIRGAYQNHSGEHVGAAVWDLWLLLRDVGSPWLGCQYDIRHAVIEGGASWPNGLKAIAPLIHTVDIKDGRWERTPGGWQPVTVPLGEGAVDFPAFFRLLGSLRVAKPVSMHFEYPFPEDGGPAARRKAAVALMRRDRERMREAMGEASGTTALQ